MSVSSARTTPETTKIRRTTAVESGIETIKRTRVVTSSGIRQVTPKAKAVLEKDEFGFGAGHSPARRLFLDDGVR